MSNERNGACRGVAMKPCRNFTTHRTQRKRWFARNSRRTPVSDISFDACFACHYPKPIVHLRRALSRRLRAFFTFRPRRQLPQRGPAPSDCLYGVVTPHGKSLAIGVIVPARVVILDYVSPIAPPRASLRALSPPATCKHIGGAIIRFGQDLELPEIKLGFQGKPLTGQW